MGNCMILMIAVEHLCTCISHMLEFMWDIDCAIIRTIIRQDNLSLFSNCLCASASSEKQIVAHHLKSHNQSEVEESYLQQLAMA